MPITQDNALLHLPLLYEWLQNSLREGGDSPEQRLCQAAIQKLQEYIQLNLAVEENTVPPEHSPPEMEICTVYLTKQLGDTETVGLSFGNIPVFGDYGEKRRGGKKRKTHQGPVLDVGCIWVTELRKNSPAGKSGKVRLRDEILSLNGQLMVGVDVSGARTCLHWACKRNHGQVVSYLLQSGADREILTTKGEMPVQLTSRREIRKIMGVEEADEEEEIPQLKKESELPFVPNYLANPAFPFIYTPAAEDSTQLQNGGPSPPPVSPPADSSPPLLPPTETPLLGAFPRDHSSLALVQNGDISAPSAILRTPESTKPGPVCQPPVSQNRSLFSVPSKPPVSLEPQNGTYAGPAPAFQPFFFTGAFPFNMQELVLKVRIQNPSLRENDFIEIELDRQELTYQELLRVSCCELGVNPDQVEKIRKLPNTLLRKDKDVARLQDFQELELVLMISDNNFLFRNAASTLTERPCYNRRASKLTY